MFIHHHQNQTLLEQNSTNGHWNETSWRIQKHVFSGFSFLKGYRPPSVLEVFQPFILKDMVSVSSSSLKKSLEQQHLPKKVIEEFGLFENFTSTFQSSYRCIRYRLDLERKHFAHLFTTCLFENICFNRKGEWILFSKSPHAKEKSEKVWVQTNSYHALTGDIHRVRIKVLDPPSAVLVRGVNGTVPNLGNSNVMELSKNFKWIEKPTFGTSRHATSNIGHAILDNFALVFNSMINFDYVSPDSHLLFMDDMYPKIPGDTRTPELVKLHGDLATNSSLEWARRMTNLEPLQQGSNHVEGSFIKNAPCEFHGMNPNDAHAHEMDTCFSSFIVGSTGSMYSFIEGRESVITLFRKYLLRQLNVKPQKKFSKVFRIAIQNKPLHSINRDAIINVDKIVNYLRQNVTESEMLELANSVRGKHEPKYERVEIVNLKLERMSFEEQVQFFGDLDVYISTQGAASYMSLFMTKPNAVMFYVPMCFRHTLTCSDLNLKIHETWATEVKIVSLIHYTHLLECVKGNSDEEPGFKVTARVHSEPYGDCHERIDPKGLYHELISKALQRLL
ncbi:hypothetical protein C9374_000753 [Naegleria lovaniensis]|uniref:Glycosyltransferase 61 catalytic domain-containing protein n=1 Tax=Naegleria lovaniensis TaxID=51637 RepID=A0AA88GWZ5_NAELO|nr:uncharacterized protein C9374_000753 [Naegleria lovaniensis]KAG2387903.1 hypothetical protein C9374_000753 [Naegleria lovaniensis]